MENAVPFDDPRLALDRLVRDRGEDYAALSRLIGRNPAYIQQFIKRGSPRSLSEQDRLLLADYLGVDEARLGAPVRLRPNPAVLAGGLVAIPQLDIGASAGAGSLGGEERELAQFAFDPRWLRQLSASPQNLAIIRVEGDSMVPTLSDGDDIMVDSSDGIERLRDGIYVLRRDDMLLVKRLTRGLRGQAGRVTIISDNSAYPPEKDVPADGLALVGRVVWAGRRIS